MTPRWPSTSGSVCAICSGQDVEGADQVDAHLGVEEREVVDPDFPRMRADGPMPAQLTTVRSGPEDSACSTAAATCSPSVTSVPT
jgi:hypothetical protein